MSRHAERRERRRQGLHPHHPHHHPGPCDHLGRMGPLGGAMGGPWDRVRHEVNGRRPGWRGRIRDEVHLYYGAHLHRKIFFSFGAVILVTVLEIMAVNHFLHGSVSGRPWRAVLCFGVPTLLLWSASGRLARRISRPLYELTRVAQRIGTGDLSARAPIAWAATGEIAMLSRSVNDMAARISDQLGRQRELLAAVSHELRTPLSRMRLLIEIAREGRLGPETLNEIERETIEIDALVGELLASARLEFQALSPKPLRADEVARRALERAGIGVDKLVSASSGTEFAADPTLVARALANLIDNARKHGGGLETLTVSSRPGFVSFAVADGGPGFAPGEETRVFASFYRGRHADGGPGAPAGSGGGGGGGEEASDRASSLGLGLALVKRIAEAHGGEVRAANRPSGGAVITLDLAVVPPAARAPRSD